MSEVPSATPEFDATSKKARHQLELCLPSWPGFVLSDVDQPHHERLAYLMIGYQLQSLLEKPTLRVDEEELARLRHESLVQPVETLDSIRSTAEKLFEAVDDAEHGAVRPRYLKSPSGRVVTYDDYRLEVVQSLERIPEHLRPLYNHELFIWAMSTTLVSDPFTKGQYSKQFGPARDMLQVLVLDKETSGSIHRYQTT